MPAFASQRNIIGPISSLQQYGGAETPYKYRQVITTGYCVAGYANSVAWQDVNYFPMATETPVSYGNILNQAGGYITGAFNRTYGYAIGVSGTGSSGMAVSNQVAKFALKTGTGQTQPSSASGWWNDPEAIIQTDVLGTGYIAYVNGSTYTSSAATTVYSYIQQWNMTTETWGSVIGTSLTQTGSGASAHYDVGGGIWYGDTTITGAAGGQTSFNFSNVTESALSVSISSYGNQKGLSSKNGFGFSGNEGNYNGGYTYRKWNYTTSSMMGYNSSMTKCVPNSGEENYLTGQNKGYTLGTYTGAGQVNDSGSYNYATDIGGYMPSSSWPAGIQSGTGSSPGSAIPGRSSGTGMWSD